MIEIEVGIWLECCKARDRATVRGRAKVRVRIRTNIISRIVIRRWI